MSFTEEALAATYVAGAKIEEGKLVTSGGRVTGTTAIANSLDEAIKELVEEAKMPHLYE